MEGKEKIRAEVTKQYVCGHVHTCVCVCTLIKAVISGMFFDAYGLCIVSSAVSTDIYLKQ